jgi:hypothetical protein
MEMIDPHPDQDDEPNQRPFSVTLLDQQSRLNPIGFSSAEFSG